jgi:hypothetical protein
MITITDRSLCLPYKDWRFTDQDDQIAIFPERESWTRIPKEIEQSAALLALLCCPSCVQVNALHTMKHQIDALGHVRPGFQCATQGCEFNCDLWLDRWNNKPLYAMSYQRGGKVHIVYTNASTQAEARMMLGAAAKNSEIIAIAPAIGFFIENKEGTLLSAE